MTVVIVDYDGHHGQVASDAKQKMIEGAVRLLAQKGLQATSFSEVLELTGAPRGSLYHHFPGGKDELVAAAVDLAGARALDLLEAKRGESAESITTFFLSLWRMLLVHSQLRAGCAVVAVTVAAESPTLLAHAAKAFHHWRVKLTDLFVASGVPEARSKTFAATLIAATEGAVVLSRAEQSLEPFELVADDYVRQARALRASMSPHAEKAAAPKVRRRAHRR